MKIFKDKSLKESIDPNKLDLGIVEGGDTQRYTFHIYNDHPRGHIRNLKVIADHKEVRVIRCPGSIGINESAEFEIEWLCDAKIEEGITPKFSFTYDLICGPTPG
jgi:hypothetical protein